MPRGHYGTKKPIQPGRAIVVGAGSVFGHTPGDVEDELNELNSEILTFDAELVAYSHRVNDIAPSSELATLIAEQARDAAIQRSWRPYWQKIEKIQSEMTEQNAPQKALELRDAMLEYDRATGLTRDQRSAIGQRVQANAERIWALRDKEAERRDPALAHFIDAWDAFKGNWLRWHSQKTTVPAQTWPLSGTWDRAQEYRQQFVSLVNRAPFTPVMTPLDPSDRQDPSLTGGLGDALKSMGTMAKVVIYGGLGIVGLIVLSSLVQHTRTNRDPVETYAKIARGGSRDFAHARALPAGE